MGQAFDRDGNVLGEASGSTKREVFETLNEMNPQAHEIRIKAMKAAVDFVQGAVTAPVQKPSIGRIVLYAPQGSDPDHNGATSLPALIVRVWSDTCVNLKVINDGGEDFWVTSVVQGPEVRNWTWPPRV